MRNKTIIGNSLLMCAGLGLAFYASLDHEKDKALAQEWVSFDPADVESVTYEAPDVRVAIAALPGKAGYWVDFRKDVEVTKEAEAPPALDPHNPTEAPKPEAGKVVEKKTEADQFKADGNASQLLDSFKPLRVERVIGDAGQVKLDDYGLGASAAKLVVKAKGSEKPFELLVGMRSFGSRNFFALDKARGKVVLVDGSQIDNLADARARMYERNVVGFVMEDARKAEITAEGGLHAKWDQSDRDKAGLPAWKDDAEGAAPQASYKTWMDKIAKLRIARYAKDDEVAAVKAAAPSLAIAFAGDKGPLDELMVRKVAKPGQEDEYWVESRFLTRPALVTASRIDPILKDVPNLLKGKK